MSSSHNHPTGRSLLPPRTRAAASRLSLDGGSDVDAAVTQHSPISRLLRFSPVHNAAATQPGVSPYNWGRQHRARFFEATASEPSSASAANTSHHSSSTSTTAAIDTASPSDDTTGVVKDGIPIDHLRGLANQALLDNSQQAIFFANLLYTKTGLASDALFLAQCYQTAGQHAACLRVLEESGILQSAYPWEGLLLACAALAANAEWAFLLQLVEDACRLTDGHGSTANQHPHNSFRSIAASQPLDDDDNFGWDALKESIPIDRHHIVIHPLARLCAWRAQAYYETGHGVRATKYWKKTLEMDSQMQAAWEALLSKNLVTAADAFELIQSLDFAPDQAWLKALYLASIELTPAGKPDKDTTPITTTTSSNLDETVLSEFGFAAAPDTSDSFALHAKNLDASSIHMMDSPERAAEHKDSSRNKWVEIQKQVNEAFDKLGTEYQLDQSPQVLAMAARRAYRRYDWKGALDYCDQLERIDPFLSEAAFCYIATLIMLGYKRVLFRVAHQWVEASPKSAKAWFAVGAYYYCCERYHVAQRHFCRATRLDPQCTEAWIAFGCSFAACDESDQALASFRAAQRLSPGEHTSLLYMGMEYVRTNHLVLANYFLQAALASSSKADPLCFHELGVLASQQGHYVEAIGWFQKALRSAVGGDTIEESIDLCLDSYWEPTVFNLGHCYRKNRQFDQAAGCYNRCIALCPDKSSTYAAFAFAKHMQGDLNTAIDYYHKALGCKAEDSFSEDLLARALQESLAKGLTVSEDSHESIFYSPAKSVATRPSLERKMSDDSDVDMSAG